MYIGQLMESANDCDDVRKKSGRFRYEFNWRTVRTVKPRRRRTKARSDSNDGNRTATSPIDSQSQSQELQRELSSLATFACGLDSSQGKDPSQPTTSRLIT